MKILNKILVFVVAAILVLLASITVGDFLLKRQVKSEVESLLSSSGQVSKVFSYDQLSGLPEPVQRYFRFALEDGQSYISYARLRHGGTFKPSEEQGWLPITGEEYFAVENPGFLWFASIDPFPFFSISARDTYFEGKGNMLIKLSSIYTMGDTKGPEMDQGSLMRWLAEAVWFPTALLPGEHLQWEEVDSDSAKATFEDSGMSVSLIFTFNEEGEITRVFGYRYRAVGDSFSEDEWVGYYREYREVDGMMIPHEVEVTWNLDSGEYSYARFSVTEIEFNNPNTYN